MHWLLRGFVGYKPPIKLQDAQNADAMMAFAKQTHSVKRKLSKAPKYLQDVARMAKADAEAKK